METDLMIDKYDTSNFLALIKKAKDGFNVCLSLESQGHKHLKDALTSCYIVAKYIKEQDLKELLVDKNLIKEESFDIKNKAKYVLWLTMGKPDKSKKTDDEIRYKRDTARLRMYKRVLEKFILKDLSADEACQFLETYGVYAIGNLSNYGLSITKGIVSIPHINITYNNITRNVIQCDLTISDGNSGGALVNSDGKLIGLTTFRLKDQSNNIIYGISYCIPINTVLEYIENN